mmetsp:Transcript_646/g.1119  ORF Transcript_646/g.1119 Transcript_646/m.1119 type:complete len:403 (+) Transcript_646:110-1318(+)
MIVMIPSCSYTLLVLFVLLLGVVPTSSLRPLRIGGSILPTAYSFPRPPLISVQKYSTSHVSPMRGGVTQISAAPTPPSKDTLRSRARDAAGDITIWITSNFGASSYLRRSQKLKITRNSTILELKKKIQKQYPGNPPVELQSLYMDSKLLSNDTVLGNITNKLLLPVQLDLLSGMEGYDGALESLSTKKIIDAYISLSVHEAYLANKLADVMTSTPSNDKNSNGDRRRSLQDSVKYRNLFNKLNESFYQELGPRIRAAQEAERDPATPVFPRIAPSFDHERKAASSLTTHNGRDFFKRLLILNDRESARLVFWSLALVVFGLFGTETKSSLYASLAVIPLLWARHMPITRLYMKVLRNFFLSLFNSVDILRRLLPAPLQVISSQSQRWSDETETFPRVPPLV